MGKYKMPPFAFIMIKNNNFFLLRPATAGGHLLVQHKRIKIYQYLLSLYHYVYQYVFFFSSRRH